MAVFNAPCDCISRASAPASCVFACSTSVEKPDPRWTLASSNSAWRLMLSTELELNSKSLFERITFTYAVKPSSNSVCLVDSRVCMACFTAKRDERIEELVEPKSQTFWVIEVS